MAKLNFEVPHSLPKDDAQKRIEQLTQYWGIKYGVKSSWNGDQATVFGKVMGVQIDAVLRVHADKVGGEASDPGLLLRGQAKKYLTGKFSAYLDPKKSLADLEKSEA